MLTAKRPLWHVVRHEIAQGDEPRGVANHVLRRMHVTKPPVPVEHIAKNLDIEVARVALADAAGVLESTRTSAKIEINRTDLEERQHFTIAHEIGHLLLHTIAQPQFRFHDPGFGPTKLKKEKEANEFAASLLMPLWMVEPIMLGSGLTTKGLAQLFKVSVAAMEVQLKKLSGT